jgi:hypothetical protein
VAKLKKGDSAGGTVDMATANMIDPQIAGNFASYGVK